jgi:hypothetical protein
MVNHLGMTLLLKEGESVVSIQNNSVLVPPKLLDTTFHFGLIDEANSGGRECYGPPLQLTDQEWHFHSLMPSVAGMVPMEGVCQSKIVLHGDQCEQMCLITITTKNEKGIRVIEVTPTIHILNKTDRKISVAAMAVFGPYDSKLVNYCPHTIPSGQTESMPLIFWQILGQVNSDRSLFDGFQNLAVKCEDSMWSDLLELDDCRNFQKDVKKTLSLPLVDDGEGSRPCNRLLAITLHQRKGKVYVVIQDEKHCQFLIHNSLSVPVLFAHSSASGN